MTKRPFGVTLICWVGSVFIAVWGIFYEVATFFGLAAFHCTDEVTLTHTSTSLCVKIMQSYQLQLILLPIVMGYLLLSLFTLYNMKKAGFWMATMGGVALIGVIVFSLYHDLLTIYRDPNYIISYVLTDPFVYIAFAVAFAELYLYKKRQLFK